MKKYFSFFIFHFSFFIFHCEAQDKRGYVWISGGGGNTITFTDTAKPVTGQLFPNLYPNGFNHGHSDICDSATGKLLLLFDGARLWDTLGNLIDNGDSLIPPKIYDHNPVPFGMTTQNSLILPKGSNGLYYLFTPTITDSMYDYWTGNPLGDGRVPYDLLQYHIVDMNANGGMGKAVQKNIPLITNTNMAKVGMMACRHANGYDWWLIKQGFDTNMVFTFLVTKDTVELKHKQGFSEPKFGIGDLYGQSCFSTDGSKYAFTTGGVNTNISKLFLADFDRCTGLLSNPKKFNIPLDSTGYIPLDNIGRKDSVPRGLCFSSNDNFIYVVKSFNVYQFEYSNPDSLQAWYLVHRQDTMAEYTLFGQLQRGIDGRIYIGKFSGGGKFNNVIDKPNIKGAGCQFCQFCLDFSAFNGASTSPSNMPDFNLGAKAPCWPLNSSEILIVSSEMEVWPNPAHTMIYIKIKDEDIAQSLARELYNSIGQLLISTKGNEVDISKLSSGIYYLKCGVAVRKVVVE